MSSQVGVHMAGAALQRSRKSMPPHATTFSPYNVMRKPGMVRNHFQKALSPMAVDVVQGSFGGGWYPLAYCGMSAGHSSRGGFCIEAVLSWQCSDATPECVLQ